MLKHFFSWVGMAIIFSVSSAQALEEAISEKECWNCKAWNKPQTPFQVYGNSYYVGTAGLSAVLITTSDGHILLDGALPQSASLIVQNIRALGFDPKEIKYLANSHAHFDHAGGLSALQKATGALVLASKVGAEALSSGGPLDDDPQFAFGKKETGFPKVSALEIVEDGVDIRLGQVALRANYTPGHTPGGTTWTWNSCMDGKCMNMVYLDSLNAVSANGYKFTDSSSGNPVSEVLSESIERVANLPCDIMISVHPGMSGLFMKLDEFKKSRDHTAFVGKDSCRIYASKAKDKLDKRIKQEMKMDVGQPLTSH